MDFSTLLSDARARIKEGDPNGARRALRFAVSHRNYDPVEFERAARLVSATSAAADSIHEVLVLGQCTTSWITQGLPALLLAEGVDASASEGQFDNVMQELMTRATAGERPRVVVLMPWTNRVFAADGRTLEQRVEDELAFWKQCWALCDQMGASIVQVGLDWTRTGSLGLHLSGEHGEIAITRAVNQALRASLPKGGFFVDLEAVSGSMGRHHFYDARRYYWTKQPFSEDGCLELGRAIASSIRTQLTGPKKVLVLDLDNTVWGGVVGETGPLGVELGESPAGEAFRAFQAYAKQLTERGVLLAVASKNNPDDAREPFTSNPSMVLSLDDIAAFEASWNPKESSLRQIAKTLNLGTDSLVFFDDNPAEREHIRQALPEVAVPEVPEDPAGYIQALERGRWFEAVGLTDEDRVRASQYRQERARRDLESSAGSMEEYLDSLDMLGDTRGIGDEDMQRVVQLIGKTNQFNLTTRRHSESTVRQMLADPNSVGFSVRLADKFGDHGLVAVVLGVPDPADSTALRVDTWLMSCRVIGRTTEEYTLLELLDRAKALGYRSIVGEYIPTKKNMLVKDLFHRLGFDRIECDDQGRSLHTLSTASAPPKSHIRTVSMQSH